MALIPSRLLRQMLANVLELNSKGLYQSSGKEEKVIVLCSRPRQNVNSGTFTLLSGNDGKEMYEKSVMHVQSCCFANQIYCFFCRSRCRLRRRCLSSLILVSTSIVGLFIREIISHGLLWLWLT